MKLSTLPKLKITLGGTPSGPIPAGCRYVGVVAGAEHTPGMLILIEATGIYAQLNTYTFLWLDQGEVFNALRCMDRLDLSENLELQNSFELGS